MVEIVAGTWWKESSRPDDVWSGLPPPVRRRDKDQPYLLWEAPGPLIINYAILGFNPFLLHSLTPKNRPWDFEFWNG
jgi:hypothetical protein